MLCSFLPVFDALTLFLSICYRNTNQRAIASFATTAPGILAANKSYSLDGSFASFGRCTQTRFYFGSSRQSEKIAALCSEMRFLSHESLRIVLVNAKYRLIKICSVSEGTLNESLAHPREIFKHAIVHSAYAFVLVHNLWVATYNCVMWTDWLCDPICLSGTPSQFRLSLDRSAAAYNSLRFFAHGVSCDE